jgi:hypothetical protein
LQAEIHWMIKLTSAYKQTTGNEESRRQSEALRI